MGLITIENLEDNTPATANKFNERFQKIASTLNGLDTENYKDGSVTLVKLASDVFSRLYPVGSIYTNATDNTNPATLLGFGTWEAFGAGRVLVGKADSGTFNAAGNTGGAETHTLTVGEMPSHNHGVNDPGHSHSITGSNTETVTNQRASEWTTAVDVNAGGTSHNYTGISIQNAGSGGAHNNLQPYIVVYTWRRTA